VSKQAGKLARRYSRAFLRAIEEEMGSQGSPTPAQQIAGSLSELAEVWKNQDSFRSAILNPMFDKTQRASALESIAKKEQVSDIVVRFIRLVFERDRIAFLPEIAESFADLANSAASVVKVEVTVAREIAGDESSQIEQSLSQHIAGSLEFDWKIDPEILGGMLVKYQGKVLDGSLHGRIQRIEKRLMS
jgi:F-type H+-transporting ATPase subunit delta